MDDQDVYDFFEASYFRLKEYFTFPVNRTLNIEETNILVEYVTIPMLSTLRNLMQGIDFTDPAQRGHFSKMCDEKFRKGTMGTFQFLLCQKPQCKNNLHENVNIAMELVESILKNFGLSTPKQFAKELVEVWISLFETLYPLYAHKNAQTGIVYLYNKNDVMKECLKQIDWGFETRVLTDSEYENLTLKGVQFKIMD